MSNRIEFYKNRDIGGRFSVAIDFLKQNWKVLYKNILLGGFPLAIILGILSLNEVSYSVGNLPEFFMYYSLYIIVLLVNTIYLYSMTGAVLSHYGDNNLSDSSGWNDLKDTFFQFSTKTFLITLFVYIPIIMIIMIIAGIFGFSVTIFSSSGSQAISIFLLIIFIFILLALLIAFAPSFIMLFFPAYFSGKTVLESIKTSFVLGFKNWGSLFIAIILTVIFVIIVSIIFSLPILVMTILTTRVTIISYILAIFSTTGTLLVTPVTIIIFAFQYFSIVEKEEGISLQSQIDEFENL